MDDEEEYYDDETWLQVGSAECGPQAERPRFRSVSPAAHRAMLVGRQPRAQQSIPVGFRIPSPVR